jgi:hypothetical protein
MSFDAGVPPSLRFLVGLAVFAAIVWASSRVGVPHEADGHEDLPDVALGWRLLFHVLRASALLGALGVVGLIAWRGAHDEWPARVGQVEYAPSDTAGAAADALALVGERLRIVEAKLKVGQSPVDGPTDQDYS